MCKREYTALSQIPIRGFSTNIEKIVIRILIGQWRPLFLGCWRKTGFLFYIFFAPPKKLFQQIKKVKKKLFFSLRQALPPPPLLVSLQLRKYIYIFFAASLRGWGFYPAALFIGHVQLSVKNIFSFLFLVENETLLLNCMMYTISI